jgi:putative protein kinase ArgK-like GTPase of G3E family
VQAKNKEKGVKEMHFHIKKALDKSWAESSRAIVVGIAGGSGSGKSTLAVS